MEENIRKAGGCTNFEAIISYPNTTTQIPNHYSYTYTLKGKVIHDEFDNVNPDEYNANLNSNTSSNSSSSNSNTSSSNKNNTANSNSNANSSGNSSASSSGGVNTAEQNIENLTGYGKIELKRVDPTVASISEEKKSKEGRTEGEQNHDEEVL